MADTTKQIKFIILTTANFNPETLDQTAVLNKLSSENPPLYDSSTEIPIVYIEAQQKIFLNGVFYGTSTADLDEIYQTLGQHASAINTHSTAISELQTNLGLPGATADADGSAFARIAKLVADLNAEVTTDRDAAITTAIGDLESTIRNFSVNGQQFGQDGSVDITSGEIKLGVTSTGIVGMGTANTVTEALSQLNTNINNINTQSAATSGAALEAAQQAMAEALLHTSVTGSTGITVAYTAKTATAGAVYEVSIDDTLIATKDFANAAATGAANAAITAIVGASGTTSPYDTLTIWGTREYAKSLVDGVYDTLNGVTSGTIELINQIAAELNDPDDENGLQSFLDKIVTLGQGFSAIGGTGVTVPIKDYIDSHVTALTNLISNAQGLADTSVQSVNGITGPTVVVGATDIAMTGFTAGISGNVAESDKISTAVSKVETKADAGIAAAATAQSTADSAVTKADAALETLHWVIV